MGLPHFYENVPRPTFFLRSMISLREAMWALPIPVRPLVRSHIACRTAGPLPSKNAPYETSGYSSAILATLHSSIRFMMRVGRTSSELAHPSAPMISHADATVR